MKIFAPFSLLARFVRWPVRTRRARWVSLAVLVAILAVWQGHKAYLRRGSSAAAGTYIAEGGQTYFVVRPGHFGALRVEGGPLTPDLHLSGVTTTPKLEVAAEFTRGRLILRQRQSAV